MKTKTFRFIIQYFIVLVMFIVIGFILVSISTSLLKNLSESSIKEVRNLSTENLSNKIEKITDLLEKLANIESLNDSGLSEIEKLEDLNAFREKNDLSDIGIVDSEGWLVSVGRTEKTYVYDRDYFQNAIKGNIFIQGPMVSRTEGEYIFAVGVPVYNDYKVENVLVGIYKIEILSDFVEDIKLYNSGNVFLLNENGMTY